MPDPAREIPVGTTGELRIEIGEPLPATEIPLSAASVRGSKASVFVVETDIARARVVPVLGEIAGKLYLDATLRPGERVVTEGRALLSDGDRVAATEEVAAQASPATAAEGGKGVKP